jgi:hypothetical protein
MDENLNLKNASTGALWELSRIENREAFMVIYDRYSARLYDYVMQVLKTKTKGSMDNGVEEKAKEIIIDVFATLWDKRRMLSKEFCIEDHLFTSALYAATSHQARISCRLN